MSNITTIGIDLAKEVFAICAMDVTGAVVYHKVLKRDTFSFRQNNCHPVMSSWKLVAHRIAGVAGLQLTGILQNSLLPNL